MADVGLLGFPNVGKSTFIRAVSRAQPKVADYPFTTLTPHLGVVRVGDEASFVLADIPGLIPGASEGAGLGHRFLKHVERCRALLHLITLDATEEREPMADYEALRLELEKFDPELAARPQIVAMTKADLPEVQEAYAKLRPKFAKKKIDLKLVSSATGRGVKDLAIDLYKLVTGKGSVEDWDSPPEVAMEAEEAEHADADAEAPAKKVPAPKKKAKAAPKKKAKAKAAPKKEAKAAPKKKAKAAPKKKAKAGAKKAPAAPRKKATAKKKATKGRR
jgi:GTP-binding protein